MRKVVLRYLIKTILSYLAVILLVIVLLFPFIKRPMRLPKRS